MKKIGKKSTLRSVKSPSKSPLHVPYSHSFGMFLRTKRLEVGLSQGKMASSLGYETAQIVSNWERGLQAPPFEKLLDLCQLLRISRKEILNVILEEQTRAFEDSLKDLWKTSKAQKA